MVHGEVWHIKDVLAGLVCGGGSWRAPKVRVKFGDVRHRLTPGRDTTELEVRVATTEMGLQNFVLRGKKKKQNDAYHTVFKLHSI